MSIRLLVLSIGLVACGGAEKSDPVSPAVASVPKRARQRQDDGRIVHYSVSSAPLGSTAREHSAPGTELDIGQLGKSQRDRIRENERNAIAALNEVATAQAAAASHKILDRNGDGVGEHLLFAEFVGARPLRGGSAKIDQYRMLTRTFGDSVVQGRVRHSGYWFQMWLPGSGDGWVTEGLNGGQGADAAASEPGWRCYAWPVQFGESGQSAFFVDDGGAVYCSNNRRTAYHDDVSVPRADAATGERSSLHAGDRYMGIDRGFWARVDEEPSDSSERSEPPR